MRLAPVVLAWADPFPGGLDLLLDRAEESSLPTHASAICRSACRYFALVLAALANGVPREAVLSPRWELLGNLGRIHPEIQRVIDGSFREKKPSAIQGSGYVVASLEAALWAFHNATDFREAVLRAVNLGDDADTTGAVCGQLAGAFWGETGIPSEWRSGLARQDLIEAALEGLTTVSTGLCAADSRRSPAETRQLPKLDPPARTYWLEPGEILAGCYPGAAEPAECERRIQHLLDLGVRTFVDLTEATELHRRQTLAPYDEVVHRLARVAGVDANYHRFAVRDLDVPTAELMETILQTIDAARQRGLMYFHCLGGVGRTGTVAACWLLTRGQTSAGEVLDKLANLRKMDKVRGHRPSPEMDAQRQFVAEWARRIQTRWQAKSHVAEPALPGQVRPKHLELTGKRKVAGRNTQGVDRVLQCEIDEHKGYCLWISEPDANGNPRNGGHSIYIHPDSLSDPAIRLALEVLCRSAT